MARRGGARPPRERRAGRRLLERRPRLVRGGGQLGAGERGPACLHRAVLRLRCRWGGRNRAGAAAREPLRREADGGGRSSAGARPARAHCAGPGRAPRRRVRGAYLAALTRGRGELQGGAHGDRRRRVVRGVSAPHRAADGGTLRAPARRRATGRQHAGEPAARAPRRLARHRPPQAVSPPGLRGRTRPLPGIPHPVPGRGTAQALLGRLAGRGGPERGGRPAAVPGAAPEARGARRPQRGALSRLQDLPRGRRAGAERSNRDGPLAGDPGAVRGPRIRGARVPAPGPCQDRRRPEQAAPQARAARASAAGAFTRAEARVRRTHRGVAAPRAARRHRG